MKHYCLLLTAAVLVSCGNPIIRDIVRPLRDKPNPDLPVKEPNPPTEEELMNEADFGPGAQITSNTTIDISAGSGALDTHINNIKNKSGSHIVTISGDGHLIPSDFPASFELGPGIAVSLRGSGTMKKDSGTGGMWRLSGGGKLILRDAVLDGNGQNYQIVDIADGGIFIMESGRITGSNSMGSGRPGGVLVQGGSFTMKGGIIDNNRSDARGGGVFVTSSGSFTLEGGSISGNTASGLSWGGGGVYVDGSSSFTMTGGTIRDNLASGSKGGGGVYLENLAVFSKTGGTIYGDADAVYNAGTNENTAEIAANGKGHAVSWNFFGTQRYRDSDLEPVDALSTNTTTNWDM